jgi:hypothetical protein
VKRTVRTDFIQCTKDNEKFLYNPPTFTVETKCWVPQERYMGMYCYTVYNKI